MLNCSEAMAAIFDAMPSFAGEDVPLAAACGRILQQIVSAERDQPPFDRVTMDGIAVRHAALASGQRHYRIAGTGHAGDAQQTLANASDCIEVMTGSVLPQGSDSVIPVERVQVRNGAAIVEDGYTATIGQFIHEQGSDHREGHQMLHAGQRISPLDVALIASAGLPAVRVARRPVVRVISTGNELVPAGTRIEAHQVRLSNGPAVVAMLAEHGYDNTRHEHLPDAPATLRKRIGAHLDDADVLVLSGGVSMGKADFVPEILRELGVKQVFHRIAQRPGKPMWFGTGRRGQAVFALPGNPVSTLVCCRHYVLPALLHASGGTPAMATRAVLAEAYEFAADLTCFLPVRLLPDPLGRLLAAPVVTNTSGDFTALSGTDGYVELARGARLFEAGSVQLVYRWAVV